MNGSTNHGYAYNSHSLGSNLNSSGSVGRMMSHSPQPHYQMGNGVSNNLSKNNKQWIRYNKKSYWFLFDSFYNFEISTIIILYLMV